MHVLERAVAVDGKGDGATNGARVACAGIDGPLLPVAVNAILHGFNVPAVASGEISAALTQNRDAAGLVAASWGCSGRQVRAALVAVGNGVRRRGFFFLKFWNFGGVGLRLRWLRRFFFVKAFGRIDSLALWHNNRLFGHGNRGSAHQINFRPAQLSSNSAPGISTILNISADDDGDRQGRMEDDGVHDELLEPEVLRIGERGGHLYWVRARVVMGSVTMLMLLMPD